MDFRFSILDWGWGMGDGAWGMGHGGLGIGIAASDLRINTKETGFFIDIQG
ncbi:MAG: hypothetical protein MUE44_26945 [Oscillatoriaceae cyanobacterium Prado104]|nr:hypothetical protein [Oscillatoriaceae cyanobacterium Prado104]